MRLYILVDHITFKCMIILKFLVAAVVVTALAALTYRWGERVDNRRRMRRWVRSETVRRFAKNKEKRVQEAVEELYNRGDRSEEDP